MKNLSFADKVPRLSFANRAMATVFVKSPGAECNTGRVIFSSIYSLYYVMGKGGEDIYEFESLAFSSCMISSTIRSL